MDFKERQAKFEEKLQELMKKFEVSIYSINAVMPDGEVLPVIKMADTQKDGDKTKK